MDCEIVTISSIDVSNVKTEEFTEERTIRLPFDRLSKLLSIEDQLKITNSEGFTTWKDRDERLNKDFLKVKVFYRKLDLSYFNFESIKNMNDFNIKVTSERVENYNEYGFIDNLDSNYYKGKTSLETLEYLIHLNNYEIPVNNSSRGGKRMIFTCKSLAESIGDHNTIKYIVKENCQPNEMYDGIYDGDSTSMSRFNSKSNKNISKKLNPSVAIDPDFELNKKKLEDPRSRFGSQIPMQPGFPSQIPMQPGFPSQIPQTSMMGGYQSQNTFRVDDEDEIKPNVLGKSKYSLPSKSSVNKYSSNDSPSYESQFQPLSQQYPIPQQQYPIPQCQPPKQILGMITECQPSPQSPHKTLPSSFISKTPSLNYPIANSYDEIEEPNMSHIPPNFNSVLEDKNSDGILHPNYFVGCNNIFRLNKFSPGDAPFKFHFDTPYVNYKRNEVSMYSVIIYLTSGSNPNGVLNIFNEVGEETKITHVEAGDIIIFNQQFPHIGNPFVEGDKIFLRTELIFNVSNLNYDEKVAEIFNCACYYQVRSNSTNDKEIQKYSSDLFNEVMRLRNKMPSEIQIKYILVSSLGVKFLTSGSKYYFPSFDQQFSESILSKIATLVIIDYLNLTSKRKRYSKILNIKDDPFDFLNNFTMEDDHKIHVETSKRIHLDNEQEIYCSCGICRDDPTKASNYFSSEYDELAALLPDNAMIIESTEVMSINNNEYSIDVKKGLVKGLQKGTIKFGTYQDSINFASCQCIFEIDEIKIKMTNATVYSFPQIIFTFEEDKGYLLSIDMFKNGFTYEQPIKYISFV